VQYGHKVLPLEQAELVAEQPKYCAKRASQRWIGWARVSSRNWDN
jgi:hypothetical protein